MNTQTKAATVLEPLPEPRCTQCGRTCEFCPFFFAQRMNHLLHKPQAPVNPNRRGPLGWYYDLIDPRIGHAPTSGGLFYNHMLGKVG